MVRQVRGPGTLVPVDIRWIAARTQGRVDRIVLLPGATVEPDSVILVLSNPDVTQAAVDAASQLNAGEADLANLRVQVQKDVLQAESDAASARANFEQARLRAQVNDQLFKDGLVSELDLKLSKVTAAQEEELNLIAQKKYVFAKDTVKPTLAVKEAEVDRLTRPGQAQAGRGRRAERARGDAWNPAGRARRGRRTGPTRREPGPRGRPDPPEGRGPDRRDPGEGCSDRPARGDRHPQRHRLGQGFEGRPVGPERHGHGGRRPSGRASRGCKARPLGGRRRRARASRRRHLCRTSGIRAGACHDEHLQAGRRRGLCGPHVRCSLAAARSTRSRSSRAWSPATVSSFRTCPSGTPTIGSNSTERGASARSQTHVSLTPV